jgi:ubiquinone/menaquinone biosynthesis C-methylase UbiE
MSQANRKRVATQQMPREKTAKELAFLEDLLIAPDWGERFAELLDEHVAIPKEGNALYLGAGTGGHAMAVQERSGENLNLLCLDENDESLILAQAKATALKAQTKFRHAKLDQLHLPDNHFDLVIGNASLVHRRRVGKMLSEMIRVTAPGGPIALTLPTYSSFGEFFSLYWEALYNAGLLDLEPKVEDLITTLPTISDVGEMAEAGGLEEVSSWTRIEEFEFDSAEEFLNAPLVSDFLMADWLASVPETSRQQITQEISRLMNEDRHEAKFVLSVKATLVSGRKTHSH